MKASSEDQQGDIGLYAVALNVSQLGWIFRHQPLRDLGIDAYIEIRENDRSKGELLGVQNKSGKSWCKEKTEEGIVFRGDLAHLEYWQNYPIPVIVVIHNLEDDVAYWQVVKSETISKTKKGWKMIVPFDQKIDRSSRNSLKALCQYIVDPDMFSILSQKDVSYGLSKRYTADVLIQGRVSKADINNLVKKVTSQLIVSEYYRNEYVKNKWRDTRAKVVRLFLYRNLEDVTNRNWMYRSLWVDPAETNVNRLQEGVDIGEGLFLERSNNYESLACFSKDNTVSKEYFLEKAIDIFTKTKKLLQKVEELQTIYIPLKKDKESDYYMKKMQEYERKIRDLYLQSNSIGIAPLECGEFQNKFQCVMSDAHNIVLPFSQKGLTTWDEENREYLMYQSFKNYDRDLHRLEYELEKLH